MVEKYSTCFMRLVLQVMAMLLQTDFFKHLSNVRYSKLTNNSQENIYMKKTSYSIYIYIYIKSLGT